MARGQSIYSHAPVTVRTLILIELGHAQGFGLDLISRIMARSGIAVSEGSIYTVLGHMERDGIIAEVPGPKRLQGRPRKHYLLTESGRVAGEEVRSILQRLAGDTWPTS